MSEYVETAITVWTIRFALVCMWIVLWIRIESAQTGQPATRFARVIWMLGSLFSVLHLLAAMGYYHHWSHWQAFDATAEETESLMGVRVGFGVYFNYLFVALWLIDAAWWNLQSASYERRSPTVGCLIWGYLIFIAINGTIIFESGPVRWIACIGLLALAARQMSWMNVSKRV